MTASLPTPGERTRQRIHMICLKHGTELHLVKRYNRARYNIEARREIATYLKMEKNWSLSQVGKLLDRDHATIHYLIHGRPRETRRGLNLES